MMKLSTRVRFGLRIMVQIAAQMHERPVFSRKIANEQNISEAYVDQILLPLRAGGLLVSQRGRAGGYRLSRPAEQISVLDVIQVLEGDLCLVDCVASPASCPRRDTCPTYPVWDVLTHTVRHTLGGITIGQLVRDPAAAARAALPAPA
jgi:Rrf2 family protein